MESILHIKIFLEKTPCFAEVFTYNYRFNVRFYVILLLIYWQAIESGRVPGDLLNDIPCKYVNGTIVCEVSHLCAVIACFVHA